MAAATREPGQAPKPNVQMLTDQQLQDAELRSDATVTRYETTRVTPWKHMPAQEKKERWVQAWAKFDALASVHADMPDVAVRAMLAADDDVCSDLQENLPTSYRISMARVTPKGDVKAEFALAQREWVLINIRVQHQVATGVLDAATAKAKLQGLAMARNLRPIQPEDVKGATMVDMDGMLKKAGYNPSDLNSKDSIMDRMRREGLRTNAADRLHTAQSVLSKTLPAAESADDSAVQDAQDATHSAARNAGMRPGRFEMHNALRDMLKEGVSAQR